MTRYAGMRARDAERRVRLWSCSMTPARQDANRAFGALRQSSGAEAMKRRLAAPQQPRSGHRWRRRDPERLLVVVVLVVVTVALVLVGIDVTAFISVVFVVFVVLVVISGIDGRTKRTGHAKQHRPPSVKGQAPSLSQRRAIGTPTLPHNRPSTQRPPTQRWCGADAGFDRQSLRPSASGTCPRPESGQ